jgi:DeoR/GlpR family transcriptional regulator of sugar metabolism
MTTVVAIGRLETLVQNTVYALPARLCNCTVITSGGTINVSLDNSTYQAITLDSNKNFQTSALFVKSTGADSQITIQ